MLQGMPYTAPPVFMTAFAAIPICYCMIFAIV